MELQFIELGKLCVSKANMRYARKAPDVSDLLPTVRKRGVIVPVLVRQNGSPETFEIVAGARRFHAANLVAEERRAEGQDIEPMPCAILSESDDADAIEASLIENVARLDADEVTRWETFTRLVKEGRDIAEISTTFGLPELGVRRILALGNLMPRIRNLYRDGEIDAVTVRHLTMASKSQQRAWLALYDDADAWVPSGHQLKAWLFGGQSIPVKHALFDTEGMGGIVSDLFGEDRYFADADAFWSAQNAAIEARREAYLEAGWPDAVIVPPSEHFASWEYEKAPKRKGGRVYIDVRSNGEVTFHEGYVTRKEARRLEKGEALNTGHKPPRPEVTGTMQTYIDLHRHAAVRAALTGHPNVALRLMVAHAIVGSHLWAVRPEPQTARNEATRESVETCAAEAAFDAKRRAALDTLGFLPSRAARRLRVWRMALLPSPPKTNMASPGRGGGRRDATHRARPGGRPGTCSRGPIAQRWGGKGRSEAEEPAFGRLAGRRGVPKGERRPLPRPAGEDIERRRRAQARRPHAGQSPAPAPAIVAAWAGRRQPARRSGRISARAAERGRAVRREGPEPFACPASAGRSIASMNRPEPLLRSRQPTSSTNST